MMCHRSSSKPLMKALALLAMAALAFSACESTDDRASVCSWGQQVTLSGGAACVFDAETATASLKAIPPSMIRITETGARTHIPWARSDVWGAFDVGQVCAAVSLPNADLLGRFLVCSSTGGLTDEDRAIVARFASNAGSDGADSDDVASWIAGCEAWCAATACPVPSAIPADECVASCVFGTADIAAGIGIACANATSDLQVCLSAQLCGDPSSCEPERAASLSACAWCSDDSECAEGSVCNAGVCGSALIACEADFDCMFGDACVDGECTPHIGVCNNDLDCGEGYTCTASICVPVTECQTSFSGWYVDNATGACVQGAITGCDNPFPFSSETACTDCLNDSNVCAAATCAATTDCAVGFECSGGYCVRSETCDVRCLDDSECVAGSVCVSDGCNSECVPGCFADSECDIDEVCEFSEVPCAEEPCAGECVDACAAISCGAGLSCVHGICIESCPDNDGDGFSALCGENDCNDNDVTTHPGAEESCDGVDNDCDGETDEPREGQCGDGETCESGTCITIEQAPPCNTAIDCNNGEECVANFCAPVESCLAVLSGWWNDRGGCTFDSRSGCENPFPFNTEEDCETCVANGRECAGGVCTLDTDCGDGMACNGGYCRATNGCVNTCASDSDCAAGDICTVPGCGTECTPEPCVDADNDGHCAEVDCDDNNSAVNSGAEEVCDGVDNDCDDETDEVEVGWCGDEAGCIGGRCIDFFCDFVDPDVHSDFDGIVDCIEEQWGTDPELGDSDGDGLCDGADLSSVGDTDMPCIGEYAHHGRDTDGDGTIDALDPDDDGDGYDTNAEWQSNVVSDVDEDGLVNWLDPDADNDGVIDGDEIANGTDPYDDTSN